MRRRCVTAQGLRDGEPRAARIKLREGSGIGVGAPQFGPRRGVYLIVQKDF